MGGVGVGQVPGGPPDEPGPVLVDQPGAQRGPGAGQPGLPGRRPGPSGRGRRSAEVTSSMPSSASGNSPSRQPRGTFAGRRVGQLGFAAAGELRDRGQLQVGGAGRQPPGRGHRADAPGCRSAGPGPRRPARSARRAPGRAASRPRTGPGRTPRRRARPGPASRPARPGPRRRRRPGRWWRPGPRFPTPPGSAPGPRPGRRCRRPSPRRRPSHPPAPRPGCPRPRPAPDRRAAAARRLARDRGTRLRTLRHSIRMIFHSFLPIRTPYREGLTIEASQSGCPQDFLRCDSQVPG